MKTTPVKEIRAMEYKGRRIGDILDECWQLDREIPTLELKAIRAVDAVHYGTVRSYLRATGLHEALILNFGLPRLDVRRVVPR
ncbi:GxxExxY protein [Myxococcota bacterium]